LAVLLGEELLSEDYGAVLVQHHAAFEVIFDTARQNAGFDIAPGGDEIIGRHCVADAFGFLFDDRALVEVRRDIVRGRPDQFHPAFISLMIGFGPLEGRQERVVNIDDHAIKLA